MTNTKLDPAFILEASAARLGVRRGTLALLAASMTANILACAALLFKETPAQTIIIPEVSGPVSRTAWVVGTSGVNEAYLEEFAVWLLPDFTNLTPSSIDASIARLLKHVHPSRYSELQTKLVLEAESLKADHASSLFYPQSIKVKADELQVTATGEKIQMIGTKLTDQYDCALTMKFELAAGRLYLVSITEERLGR